MEQKQTYIMLKSDNYDYAIMTREAYRLIRLDMSTGDFNTHKIIVVNANEIDPDETIIQVEDIEYSLAS